MPQCRSSGLKKNSFVNQIGKTIRQTETMFIIRRNNPLSHQIIVLEYSWFSLPKELICRTQDDHYFLLVFVVGAPPQSPGTPPPAYSEMPPPYAPPMSMNTEPSVICRVCQQLIYIRGREHQRVVKCGNCQEATVRNTCIYIFSSVVTCF